MTEKSLHLFAVLMILLNIAWVATLIVAAVLAIHKYLLWKSLST